MKVNPIDLNETNIYGYTITVEDKKNHEHPGNKKFSSRSFKVPTSNKILLENCKIELMKEDTILSVSNLALFGLSVMQHNLYFENLYVASEFVNNLRTLILALAISSTIWIIRRYQIVLSMMLANYKATNSDNLYSSGLYKALFFEIFIALLVMPPYSDFTFTVQMLGFSIEYSFSAIVTFASFLRLFYSIRLFGHYSEYTHLKAAKICQNHGTEANESFALKSFMNTSSFLGVSFNFFFMCLFFSLSMQLADEPDYIIGGKNQESPLRSFWDNLWVLCYTTTTVGYGNIYPKSHLGRACCIISCVLGNMYLGMLILAIHKSMSLDYNQNLSYAWISRNSFINERRKHATNAIRSSVTLYLLSRKWKGKVVSPIKPNGIVRYRGVTVHNDLLFLTEEQYRLKLKIYRELRNSLDSLKDVIKESRDVGRSDEDIIYEFEDVVRIDFPAVLKRIKGKIGYEDTNASESFANSCLPLESNCKKVKDFTKYLKKRFNNTAKKKTTVVSKADFTEFKSALPDIKEYELS